MSVQEEKVFEEVITLIQMTSMWEVKVDIMEEEMLEMAIQEDIGTSITNVEVEMEVEELHISLSKADFLRYLKRPIKVMFFWLLADKEAQPHTLIMIYRYLFIHLVAVK